jgi:D-mannonate dehydratase
MKSNSNFTLSSKHICAFFSITRETLRKWKQNPNFPKKARIRHGTYNLKEIFDWWHSNFMGDAEMPKRMLSEKLKYQEARSLREKLEVEELQRKLISIDKLQHDLSFIFVNIRAALLLWGKRLPGLLEGKDQKKMCQVIHKETRDILTTFGKGVKSLCEYGKKRRYE